jgi:hypothetical protein
MLGVVHIILVAALACQLQTRMALLGSFHGLARYVLSFGLTLFLVNWADFLCYGLLGWGWPYLLSSWTVLLLPIAYLAYGEYRGKPVPMEERPCVGLFTAVRSWRQWNGWFLFVAGFVLLRYYSGLDADEQDHVWSNFNFEDSAYHLSMVNALLNAPRFPPMDLNMAPYPLKYHFLADFYLAHLNRLGLPLLTGMLLMNCLSAMVLVGSLWAVFQKWLGLSARWVMLACAVFLYLNIALLNVVHFWWLKSPYFNPGNFFRGVLLFPYFNFEAAMVNMFNPQRGLLFTFPVLLLILNATIDAAGGEAPSEMMVEKTRAKTLQAAILVCLLPLSHVVGFAVLGGCIAPRLWQHRRWLAPRYLYWGPALVLACLQLAYFGFYGPPPNAAFSAWDVAKWLPLGDFSVAPPWLRRFLFWMFVDGDFLLWGGLFAGWALLPGRWAGGGLLAGLRDHLRRWRWYFAVCGFFFILINCYRYSFAWGDSNKFVLFLNLGLTLVIVQGASRLAGPRLQYVSRGIWWFLLVLSLAPAAYRFVSSVVVAPHGETLLFHRNCREAARWLRESTRPSDVVLTACYGSVHFVTSLAGRPVVAGIYGDSNPYRQDEREGEIRRVYEGGDLQLLTKLQPRYICISRFERQRYRLHPCWAEFIGEGKAVVFHAGEADDFDSVFILDARLLHGPPPR